MSVKGIAFSVALCLLVLLLVFLAGVFTGSRSGSAREQELQRERAELQERLTGIQNRNQELERSLAEETAIGSRLQEALTAAEQRLRDYHSRSTAGFTELQERFDALAAETQRGLSLSRQAELGITRVLEEDE